MALEPALQAEQDFINQYVDATDADPAASAAASPTGKTSAPATETTDEVEETVGDDNTSETTSDEETDTQSTDETEGDEGEESEGAGAGEGTAADEEEEEEAPPARTEDISAETRARLKKHGLGQTVEDLPAEAQPLVRAKLKEIDRVVTRTLQEATDFRKERTTLRQELAEARAQLRFQEEHPELAITRALRAKPGDAADAAAKEKLAQRITARLKTIGEDEDGLMFEAFDSTFDKARSAIVKEEVEKDAALEAQRAAVVEREARGLEMMAYLQDAAAALDIPFETKSMPRRAIIVAVEEAILEKDPAVRYLGLTNRELDRILTRHAKELAQVRGAARTQRAKTSIQEQTRERRTASPASRSGGGTAPGPIKPPKPKTDAEFAEQYASR